MAGMESVASSLWRSVPWRVAHMASCIMKVVEDHRLLEFTAYRVAHPQSPMWVQLNPPVRGGLARPPPEVLLLLKGVCAASVLVRLFCF